MEELTLPQNWVVNRLGDFVFYQKGKKPKSVSKNKTASHNVPYVNIKAFERGIIDEFTDGAGCVLCEQDDFLMVWDGARSGYIGRAIKGALGSTLVKIQFPGVNLDYAYFYLQSKYLEINTRAKGTGIPHVDPNLVWNYSFPLPPLTEQHRIVEKIEELFSELDKGIETLKTAQQQLKVYRQAVLKYAFEGKLTNPDVKEGELPKGWEETMLSEVCDMKAGFFVKADEISTNKNEDNFPCYGGNGLRGYVKSFTHQGIFPIVGRQGALCGNVHLVEGTFHATEHAVVVTAKSKVDVKWLYHKLKHMNLNEYSTGTAQPGLSVNKLLPLNLLIPKVEEQILMTQEIESRLSVCDKIEESIEQGLQQAEALRQSILKKAFEGKLVPQDPNDEPASVLLERIIAKRSVAQPVKKTKTKKVKA